MGSAGLGAVPPPGEDIQAQQGGLGSIQGQPGGGMQMPQAPDPNGETVSKVEAIKKVLESIARSEPMMAPFAARATAILDSGVAAVRSTPKNPEAAGGAAKAMAEAGLPSGPGAMGGGPPLA
jgi:hypothetical protein